MRFTGSDDRSRLRMIDAATKRPQPDSGINANHDGTGFHQGKHHGEKFRPGGHQQSYPRTFANTSLDQTTGDVVAPVIKLFET
jgi:hypothetical protein